MGAKKPSAGLNIRALFAQGSYEQLVTDILENSNNLDLHSAEEKAYLVGSLVFCGRRQDAKSFLKKHLSKSEKSAAAIARFFLIIGACRDSDYKDARALLGDNWRDRRAPELSAEALFFVYQGFGFFRNMSCRYTKSQMWSERAWSVAFAEKFHYGCLLSADLKGHNLVQMGELSRGIKSLEMAQSFSKKLGDGNIRHVLEISLLVYRIQHGLNARAETALKKYLKRIQVHDTYSKSNLTLAYARWLTLCGRATEARALLADSTEAIFKHGHRRQKASLLHQTAHLLLLHGDTQEALRKISEGLKLLTPEIDLLHLSELLGLKNRITGEHGDELFTLTQTMGRHISQRIYIRHHLSTQHPMSWDKSARDDVIGYLMDHLKVNTYSVREVQNIFKSRWLGLLRGYLKDSKPEISFLLELTPKQLVVFYQGDVWISPEGLTPATHALLRKLAKGRHTKEELVESLWGYQYDSLRHDSMLYATIHRLRKTLGPFEKFLSVEDSRYLFTLNAQATVFERHIETQKSDQVLDTSSSQGLNIRQIKAIEILQKIESINISKYAKILKVSKPTATRDLTTLVKMGRLVPIGRARATVYTLPRK